MSDRDKAKAINNNNSSSSNSNIKHHSQANRHFYEASFDHKSPRPPVPGEERNYCMSDWGGGQIQPQMHNWYKHKSSSPTPRKYYNQPNESNSGAPHGYEPEGSCRSNSRPSSRQENNTSPPNACLRWAESLHTLLQDSAGVALFKEYLVSEGSHHADALDFWFACEGLRRQQESDTIHQCVKAIYKKFFVKSALLVNDELRKEIGKKIKSPQCLEPPVTLFDQAQAQVEYLINKTTYPNFLKSDMYLQYLENVQNPSRGSSEVSNEYPNFTCGPDPLPTLHEDVELITPSIQISHTSGTASVGTGYHTPNLGGPARLTKNLLLMSQKHRAIDVRPKSETFVSSMMYRGAGIHAAYNSYNPVSRQDSEMQSLSSHSDARTESDNMSLTDSSVDGMSMARSSRRQIEIARQSAALNRETHMNQTVIPRTQCLDTRQCEPMNCDQFATILIEKLEKVRRDQEAEDLLDRKLKEGEAMSDKVQSRELANAIREKLQMDDDNVQDILDQHVLRVFSDLTPSRSPGVGSPRVHSPPRNRHTAPPVGYNPARPRKKDKDGFSTFSSDSGNVHDFNDGSEHKMAMVKSKSMPEYAEERFVRGSTSRRSSSKKTLTDLTDSGVSVVSDTPPIGAVRDNRVLAWLWESDKGGRGASHTHSEMSCKHRSHRTSSATSPNANRSSHRKNYTSSRSSSLERNTVTDVGPSQPFIADPNMPLLPQPNTTVQLEEARRRLLEEDIRTRTRQRSSGRHYPDLSQSSQSTLRKSMRGTRQSLPVTSVATAPVTVASTNVTTPDEVTTVVFSFCDEQFPYRTKIPGTQITLRQFKDYLPKKGNYRFFFKTVCEELDNQVIQEEVSNDGDVLPLCDGKIMAQVKPID